MYTKQLSIYEPFIFIAHIKPAFYGEVQREAAMLNRNEKHSVTLKAKGLLLPTQTKQARAGQMSPQQPPCASISQHIWLFGIRNWVLSW